MHHFLDSDKIKTFEDIEMEIRGIYLLDIYRNEK